MTTERRMWINRANTSVARARYLVAELKEANRETNLLLLYIRDASLTPAEQHAKDTA